MIFHKRKRKQDASLGTPKKLCSCGIDWNLLSIEEVQMEFAGNATLTDASIFQGASLTLIAEVDWFAAHDLVPGAAHTVCTGH